MSIAISMDEPEAILVAGEWYTVLRKSFVVDAGGYEALPNYFVAEDLWFVALVEERSGKQYTLTGPISSIQAVALS